MRQDQEVSPGPYYDNDVVRLYQADARAIPMPDQSVHCVVTSPPYYGLRVYTGVSDQGIGLDASIGAYVANLVDVFREVRRVLRDDGVLWLNLGDSYGDGGNRLGIPERVVLALQADGWTWRDTVIWAKKSAMPESLAGWRWEQCRVKVQEGIVKSGGQETGRTHSTGRNMGDMAELGMNAQWAPCPGCPKCADNDGLVLRKGSWRTTSSHEYIYMLTKGMGYYADGEAVKTAGTGRRANTFRYDGAYVEGRALRGEYVPNIPGEHTANRRSVWNDISPEPYGGAHFATFPSDLPRICIQASTSEHGVCPQCGRQWARVTTLPDWYQELDGHSRPSGSLEEGVNSGFGGKRDSSTKPTLGWRHTCGCKKYGLPLPAVPATVLDPFCGTGTTCSAAQKLGRRSVGVDLSEVYLRQAVKRLGSITLPMLGMI